MKVISCYLIIDYSSSIFSITSSFLVFLSILTKHFYNQFYPSHLKSILPSFCILKEFLTFSSTGILLSLVFNMVSNLLYILFRNFNLKIKMKVKITFLFTDNLASIQICSNLHVCEGFCMNTKEIFKNFLCGDYFKEE